MEMAQRSSDESSQPSAMHDEPLMSVREAAALCHVDYDTMLRWVAKGVLPHVVVGPHRAKRVYRCDVVRLIQSVR